MALVVSLVVTFFLYTRIKRQYAQTTQPIKIVATSKALEPGKPLTAEDLMLVDWPVNVPLSGAVNKPESVLGRIVLYPIAAQEPIREQLLAAPGASVGLTAKIPDGMRAVAIQTNEVNNVSGFLFPGCHVDALVTFRPEQWQGLGHGDRTAERRGAQHRRKVGTRPVGQAAERKAGDRVAEAG